MRTTKRAAREFQGVRLRYWLILGLVMAVVLVGTSLLVARAQAYDPVVALDWKGFYRADHGISQTSNAVDGWGSQEGGETFLQTTATKKPTLTASSFGTMPGIQCDGTTDIMSSSTAFLNGTSGYVVLYGKVGAAGGVVLSVSDIGTSSHYVHFKPSELAGGANHMLLTQNESGGDQVYGSTTVSGVTPHVFEWWSDGTSYYMALDGVDQTLTAGVGANTGDWFGDTTLEDFVNICAQKDVADGVWFSGTIGVLGVIDGSVPTPAERASLRSWVTNSWAAGVPDPTPTPTATPTVTPTATPAGTATPTPIPTSTPLPTATPAVTVTATPGSSSSKKCKGLDWYDNLASIGGMGLTETHSWAQPFELTYRSEVRDVSLLVLGGSSGTPRTVTAHIVGEKDGLPDMTKKYASTTFQVTYHAGRTPGTFGDYRQCEQARNAWPPVDSPRTVNNMPARWSYPFGPAPKGSNWLGRGNYYLVIDRLAADGTLSLSIMGSGVDTTISKTLRYSLSNGTTWTVAPWTSAVYFVVWGTPHPVIGDYLAFLDKGFGIVLAIGGGMLGGLWLVAKRRFPQAIVLGLAGIGMVALYGGAVVAGSVILVGVLVIGLILFLKMNRGGGGNDE